MTFGEIIKHAREAKGLSQGSLAKILQKNYNVRVSSSYLSMLETNARDNPTVKLINALLHYFSLPLVATTSLFYPAATKAPTGSLSERRSHNAQQEIAAALSEDFLAFPKENLPKEALVSLRDFHAFLIAKYGSDSKSR